MVPKKYKVLIVGCGGQGAFADAKGSGNEHKVISFAHACKEREDVLETWVYDKNKKYTDVAFNAANEWGFKVHEIDKYNDYDIIIIATPDNEHYNQLLSIVECSKPKLVICEKPLCETILEVQIISDLYYNAKIPIIVNYTRRFIPEIIDLKKHGKAVFCNAIYNRGDMHTGTHLMDLINMFNLPLDKCNIKKAPEGKRVWFVRIDFEDGYKFIEQRIGDMPVPSYYDFHMRYVIDNAIDFLKGNDKLKCDNYDAMKAIKRMEVFNSGF